jgi:hypothetical protein
MYLEDPLSKEPITLILQQSPDHSVGLQLLRVLLPIQQVRGKIKPNTKPKEKRPKPQEVVVEVFRLRNPRILHRFLAERNLLHPTRIRLRNHGRILGYGTETTMEFDLTGVSYL